MNSENVWALFSLSWEVKLARKEKITMELDSAKLRAKVRAWVEQKKKAKALGMHVHVMKQGPK